jgi:hypothetical protein
MRQARGVTLAALAIALVAGVALLAAPLLRDGSRGRHDAAAAGTSTTKTLATPRATYLLEPAGRPAVGVSLELAATPAARKRGLMGRTSVPDGTGMVFLMPSDTSAKF